MQQDSQLIAYHELIQWRPMAAKTQAHSYKYNMQKLPGDRFTSRNIEIQLKHRQNISQMKIIVLVMNKRIRGKEI